MMDFGIEFIKVLWNFFLFSSYFWTKSLFGRSVNDPNASIPKGYNEDSDNHWRRELFALKSTKRTIDEFIPPEDA